jgi:Mn-dependent DtxR family transcriptional regulator
MAANPFAEHPIDAQILTVIDRLRTEHHACSPGMIALALRVSKNHVVDRCDALRQRGMVEWSAGIGGSLRRVGRVEVSRAELDELNGVLADFEREVRQYGRIDDELAEALAQRARWAMRYERLPTQTPPEPTGAVAKPDPVESTAPTVATVQVPNATLTTEVELSLADPLPAPEVVIDGQTYHVDLAAVHAALAARGIKPGQPVKVPAREVLGDDAPNRPVTVLSPGPKKVRKKRGPVKRNVAKKDAVKRERTPAQKANDVKLREAAIRRNEQVRARRESILKAAQG